MAGGLSVASSTSMAVGPTSHAGAATWQPGARFDPVLRALMSRPTYRQGDLGLRSTPDGRLLVPILVVTDRPDAVTSLKALGARVSGELLTVASAGRHKIVSIDLPLEALPRLETWGGLIYAEAERVRPLLLDRSVPEIRGDVAKIVYGRSGRGVTIGLVDSGVDPRNSDFTKSGGQTRVRWFWDQTDTAGPAPTDFPYGREYAASDIDAAIQSGRDSMPKDSDTMTGHGTHVAGIAASNGSGSPYQGVAPGSDLVVVKWDSIHGLDAIRYIVARTQAARRPAIINNSWGGQTGPHDGTDAESQGIGQLVGPGIPGRAICFAAGNAGSQTIHLGGILAYNQAISIPISVSPRSLEFEVEVWADSLTTFRFGVSYPTDVKGTSRAAVTVESGASPATRVDVAATPGQPYASAHVTLDAVDRPYPLNPLIQRCTLHIDLHDTEAGVVPGLPWFFTLARSDAAGSGKFDAWTVLGTDAKFEPSGANLSPDTRETLVNQACIPGVISVGAYVTKTSWVSVMGQPVSFPDDSITGDAADFSAQGPTRDGRFKPEIVAPGQWVASTLSSDVAVPTGRQSYLTEDGQHLLLAGTSMASPHVAGTLALMLDANPTLDEPHMVQILTKTARSSAGWTPSAGYGRLDAFESLRRAVLQRKNLPGDLNGDGVVDIKDVRMALDFLLSLRTPLAEEIVLADVAPPKGPGRNHVGDGHLTLADVVRILRRAVHLESDPWP